MAYPSSVTVMQDAGSGDEDKARGVKRTVPDGSPATSKVLAVSSPVLLLLH